VPELSRLKNVFAPWQQDRLTLKMAGIELGKNYPQPIVDLEYSRKQALEIFSRLS
jgi:deoxyribodipyrimidine photo-lyase